MTTSKIGAELEKTLVEDFLTAVIVRAEYLARLTMAALEFFFYDAIKTHGPRPTIHLPKPVLLELAAVMELRCWERSGTREHIDAGLPTFADAALDLAFRLERGSQEFADPHAATLSQKMFQFWATRFAWSGIELLGAGVVVAGVDEEYFVEAIAKFLWENRDSVTRFCDYEE